ncbi:MAG: hypothetical protein HYW34_00305 [Candidatus Brennerbacteria bacterium]|nr:hypothetical protein [Candidatus Brennerbacteria bacterium]
MKTQFIKILIFLFLGLILVSLPFVIKYLFKVKQSANLKNEVMITETSPEQEKLFGEDNVKKEAILEKNEINKDKSEKLVEPIIKKEVIFKTALQNNIKKVIIIEVALFDTKYADNTNYIDKTFLELVNAPTAYSIVKGAGGQELRFDSLHGIDDWFAQEYKRITGYEKEVFDIKIVGPFSVSEQPPHKRMNDSCLILQPYFQRVAIDNGVDISKYDIAAFVFFDDFTRITPDRLEQSFWSCQTSGSSYNMVFVDFNVAFFSGISVGFIDLAHELFHGLGAYDTYDGWRCIEPDGIPEPNKEPKYPQSKACLMCRNIMIGENASRATNSLDEVMICKNEAKAVKWTK